MSETKIRTYCTFNIVLDIISRKCVKAVVPPDKDLLCLLTHMMYIDCEIDRIYTKEGWFV